ncbi:unnamed protein product [Caenorhabditis angaria]|uniref:Sulfotransferase domain-containing protein n=1 Tax=Caenorhabditis angaria TaxID=860376 RepID=A0A9P1N521_9PELO|nr:unnamed protein product [Caenorhabditis angaria]
MKHFSNAIILTVSIIFLLIFGEIVNFHQFSFNSPDFSRDSRDVLEFIAPFQSILSDYLTSPSYGITTCSIRKSMSKMMFNTMCLLYDSENFLRGGKYKRCSYSDPNFAALSKNFTTYPNFTNVVFIRDPFDRFLSLYLDKCVRQHKCFDCNEDMRCVVREIYNSLKQRKSASFMDLHSAPSSWFCDFENSMKTYDLLIIGSDLEERKVPALKFSKILEDKGVPRELIRKIVGDLLVGETEHSTHRSKRRKIAAQQIRQDPIVREYLHKIYLNDYLIFPQFNRSHLDQKYQQDDFDLVTFLM